MKLIFGFLKTIKSFWRLYLNYGYDGNTLDFIIRNYQEVLENRTELVLEPT